MKDTLVLKNGVVIELEAGANISALQVLSADRAAMVATWGQFTEDNLAEVHVQSGGGAVDSTYTDLVLVQETSTVAADGTILTTYSLRVKTSEEKRLDALERGQDVQDGAIGDIAAVTSAIADQVEGGAV